MTTGELCVLLLKTSAIGVLIITVCVGGGAIVGWVMKERRR